MSRRHAPVAGIFRRTLIAAALAVAAGPLAAESGGRLLYNLNCIGCHPMPERDPLFGVPGRPVGAFYQTEAGRKFFIRLPAPGAPPLSPADDALLLDELLTWKNACLALSPATELIRFQPRRMQR